MTALLSGLRARLFGPREDSAVIADYIDAICRFARRAGLLPLTEEKLTRIVLFDLPTDVIRALLAAYDVTVDPAAFDSTASDASPVDSGDELPAGTDDVSAAAIQIVTRAYFTAKAAGRNVGIVDPADVLVSLASHPVSAAALDRSGLTRLKIAYFLSHGRPLAATPDEELKPLTDRSGDTFVLIRNDDYTPMDFVMRLLTEELGLAADSARETVLMIHRHQAALLGPYPYDEAHARATRTIVLAREAGEPLFVELSRNRATSVIDELRRAKHQRLRLLSARQGRPGGFILRHWRGELGFAAAFWKIGVTGSVLIWGTLTALIPRALLHFTPHTFAGVAIATFTGFMVITTWQWTGIWRAASRYRTGTPGRRLIGTFAQVGMAAVAFSVIWLAASTMPHLRGVRQAFSESSSIPPYSITLVERDVVEFDGGFRLGASNALKRVLDAHPDVRILRLRSVGGLGAEGALMRSLVIKRGLITHVREECSSACTLAFIGGSRRYLSEHGRLSFHRGRHGLRPDAPESAWPQSLLLSSAGIEKSFVDRVANTPARSVWVPSHAELLAAGVVHEIGEPPGMAPERERDDSNDEDSL